MLLEQVRAYPEPFWQGNANEPTGSTLLPGMHLFAVGHDSKTAVQLKSGRDSTCVTARVDNRMVARETCTDAQSGGMLSGFSQSAQRW